MIKALNYKKLIHLVLKKVIPSCRTIELATRLCMSIIQEARPLLVTVLKVASRDLKYGPNGLRSSSLYQ